MNIRLVTDFDLDSFETMFPEIKVLSVEDDGTEIDLLVFPGGADVSLDYYLDDREIKEYEHLCNTNRARDEFEKNILNIALTGEQLKVNKILGICRGAQFLNVMFGGKLFPDINTFGIVHNNVHQLRHHKRNALLEYTRQVNSYHHQGIRIPGGIYEPLMLATSPRIIATDMDNEVVEIITWMDGKVLGIQCHPEYYVDSMPEKIGIREVLYKWIAGDIKILGE